LARFCPGRLIWRAKGRLTKSRARIAAATAEAFEARREPPREGGRASNHVRRVDVRHERSVVGLFGAYCRELGTPAPGQQCRSRSGTKNGISSALPMAFDTEFLELCPHRRKPPLEDTDDLIADLGGREDDSVYKPTPSVNLILGADDYFTSIAIYADEALGFLNLLHQIRDGLGQVSICSLSDRALRHLNRNIPALGWVSRDKNPARPSLEVASADAPANLTFSALC
jgi:hypothetical protein